MPLDDLGCPAGSARGAAARAVLSDLGAPAASLTDLLGPGPIAAREVRWVVATDDPDVTAVQGLSRTFDDRTFLARLRAAGAEITALPDGSTAIAAPTSAASDALAAAGLQALLQSSFRYVPGPKLLVRYGFGIRPAAVARSSSLAGRAQVLAVAARADRTTGAVLSLGARACDDEWQISPRERRRFLDATFGPLAVPALQLATWTSASRLTVVAEYADPEVAAAEAGRRRDAVAAMTRLGDSASEGAGRVELVSLAREDTRLVYQLRPLDGRPARLLAAQRGTAWRLCRH